MKFRVGRKKGTVILDEVGSVVTEFVYKKSDGEAQRLANEYVAFKNATLPTDDEVRLAFDEADLKGQLTGWLMGIKWYKQQMGR